MNICLTFTQTAKRLSHFFPPLPLDESSKRKMSVFVGKYLALAFLSLLPTASFAQGRIKYVYDAAGNRVRREAAVPVQKSMARRQAAASEEQTQPDLPCEHTINIWPNPTDGLLKAGVSGIGGNDEWSLDVYTPLGALILAKQVKGGSADIDISGCPAGVYLIKITVNNSSTIWKIVKK